MSARFPTGARVRVKALHPPGHVRAPFYLRGKTGEVAELVGHFADPERLAYGQPAPDLPLYRVRFAQGEVWPDHAERIDDTLLADIYETWLEQPEEAGP